MVELWLGWGFDNYTRIVFRLSCAEVAVWVEQIILSHEIILHIHEEAAETFGV